MKIIWLTLRSRWIPAIQTSYASSQQLVEILSSSVRDFLSRLFLKSEHDLFFRTGAHCSQNNLVARNLSIHIKKYAIEDDRAKTESNIYVAS